MTLKILLAFLAYNARVGSLEQAKIGYLIFIFKNILIGGKLLGHACNTGSKICLVNYIMLFLRLEWINRDDNHGSDELIFFKKSLKIIILLSSFNFTF